jgi:hypothetical protein
VSVVPQGHLSVVCNVNDCLVVAGHTGVVAVGARWNGAEHGDDSRSDTLLHHGRQVALKRGGIGGTLKVVGVVHDEADAGFFTFELAKKRRVGACATAGRECATRQCAYSIVADPATVGADTPSRERVSRGTPTTSKRRSWFESGGTKKCDGVSRRL